MSRYVVDTNVPIVANGQPDKKGDRQPSIDCRIATIKFLTELRESGRVLVDFAGEIQAEYRTHLNPRGQPGVGDRFYQDVLNSSPRLIERIDLPKRADGEYADMPQELIDRKFDKSDRKFAALGCREQAPIMNATDSDWLVHREALERNGISVKFLCGCDERDWFVGQSVKRKRRRGS